MPATKHAMTRYKLLDELLSDPYHDYSIDDLTEAVSDRLSDIYPDTNGVGRRTIEKDLKYLEEEGPFLAEIKRYSIECFNPEKQKNHVKQCLKYQDPTFSIFKKEMSSDEKYLLREILSLLGNFQGLPNLSVLEQLRTELGMKEKERTIISFTRNPLNETNILGEIFTAISRKQTIAIEYHKFSEPQNNLHINLYPHLIKEYNRRWFLFATNEIPSANNSRQLLCFGLERIDKVTTLPSHKYIEYEGNIEEQFEDIIGVTLNMESPIYNIVFWVSDFSKDYVLTKPLHESQKRLTAAECEKFYQMYPSIKGGIIFQIQCRNNYELIRELASFGKELLVLSNNDIQQALIEHVYEMHCGYDNLLKNKQEENRKNWSLEPDKKIIEI